MIPIIFRGPEVHVGFWVHGYDDDVLQWMGENGIAYTSERLRTQYGYFDSVVVFNEPDYMAIKLKWT